MDSQGPALAADTLRLAGGSRLSGAPGIASRRSLRRLFTWCPRPPCALLDVPPNKSSYDLGRRRVLLGAQALEESLLAWIDEDRQACGTDFESHGRP